MNIVIIASSYPTILTPTKHVFLQKLVWAFAENGHNCSVVSPIDYRNKNLSSLPLESEEFSPKNKRIKLFFPRYLGMGFSKKSIFDIHLFSMKNYTNCVYKVIKKMPEKVDILYSHFLTPAGVCASRISEKTSIKAYVAFGESNMWSVDGYGLDNIKKDLSSINGFVAVSSENKRRLIDAGIADKSKIRVFPNGVNHSIFKKYDKEYCRSKFGFRRDQFIVAFVGQFNERKGVSRVAEALDNLDGVHVAFAGKGLLEPNINNCVYNGIVKPEDMPLFLNAADVFVLPTLNEGCCNAIIEAMACGLPIISSNLPFNQDILNENNSIMIDPKSIEEIREAVLKLKEDKDLRIKLSESSLESASTLNVDTRANNILSWMINGD